MDRCRRIVSNRSSLGAPRLVALALVFACSWTIVPNANASFEGCGLAPATGQSLALQVGKIACQKMTTQFLGNDVETAFSYFVPAGCGDPLLARTCPVLYMLHGFGGDYTSEIRGAQVAALTSGPPVDPRQVPDPWNYSDPQGWIPLDSLDFILIAPHGRTLDNGYGPAGGLDSFWADWNLRYAAGGDSEHYPTPPPRFEAFLLQELIPFVEGHFPAGTGREWRALQGTSLGGYGSYKNGLQHPDLWSSIGSISGAMNFLFAPGLDPLHGPAPVGIAPPLAGPYEPLPGLAPAVVPLSSLPDQAKGFAVALYALGDPEGDQAYYRGNMPRDLAMNARASAGGEASLHIRGFVNDAVPRTPEDFANPQSYLGAQAFEAIVLSMNIDMEIAFQDQSVEHDPLEIHPGIHSGRYWNPFLRALFAAQYAQVRHWDEGGSPPPLPTAFDFRSIAKDFSIWGWRFQVDRPSTEFLTLRNVTCDGLTLRGTGRITVTVPQDPCGTKGFDADGDGTPENPFTVDLGPSFPTDEQAGTSAAPVYGKTTSITLTATNP